MSEEIQWSPDNMLEVTIKQPDDFLKVRETLTRIGVASRKDKTLFQSCHILHKQGKYYIVHFKELFALDGKKATLVENDIQRSLFDEEKSRLLKIFPSVQERIETLADLTQQVMFLIDEPFVVDELDWQDVNNEEAQKYLFLLREEFINLDNFSLDSIEIVMRKTLEEINVKTKIGFQAARVSITGTKISPPLFESIFALGREAVIARLAESIEKL